MNFSVQTILDSFFGMSIALSLPLFIWIVKSAYEKYRREIIAISKFERIYVNNLIITEDYIHLIKQWIVGLKSNRPYVCYFGKFIIDDETHMKISDIGLINKIVKTNSFLKRMGEDINGIYKNYVKVISGITDGKTVLTEDQLKFYNNNLAEVLGKILKKIEEGDGDVIKTLAHIRLAGRVKFHSIFGYFSVLFRDVFPFVNDKKVEEEVQKINKEIETKSKVNKLN